jgi:ribosomal protein S27AE
MSSLFVGILVFLAVVAVLYIVYVVLRPSLFTVGRSIPSPQRQVETAKETRSMTECPRCGGPTEEGYVVGSFTWTKEAMFPPGLPMPVGSARGFPFLGDFGTPGIPGMPGMMQTYRAYRCPRCGLVCLDSKDQAAFR